MKPLPHNPKISILMASYNSYRHLDIAIKSVAQQKRYPNWELIIVDDCSKDNSLQIAKSWSKKDGRVKSFKNPHRLHCSSTYANALSFATGDICGILDGDDFLLPNAMTVIVDSYIRHPDVGFIYTQSWWCDEVLTKLGKGISKLPQEGLLADESKGLHCFSHWRTFRTELRDMGFIFPPGLTSAVDKALGYRLEELSNGGFLEIPLYLYRRNPRGISRTKNTPRNAEGYTNQRWQVVEDAKKRREESGLVPFPIIKI